MSDRSVSVFLKANVSGYVASIEKAKLATRDFAKSAEKSATTHKGSWDKVGKGMLLTGGVIAVGVGLAVKAFSDFDKEMSAVKAVSGASARQMEQLGKAAIKAGADTVFSASEAAQAEGELAKAGVKTSDILGGALTGSLNLASAGGLGLADAATIAAQSMNVFKLGGQDVSHIADVLAAGANKSAADVSSLGEALKQGGLVAAQTGLHLEDTTGILSMFADSALVGSDAGTSLKTMLMRLVPQSDKAQAAMDKIGFSAYDASGKFVGMESVASQLQTGLGKLSAEQRSAALNTIFGSDATRAASILYDQGAEGVREYTDAVNDQGAASRMAAAMLDNLSGDFEGLKGSIDTALIQSGSAGNDVLRSITQSATGAVNAFGRLPGPVQKSALGFAAVVSGGLLVGGAFLTVVPKIIATKKALDDLHVTSGRTGTALKGLGKAAGVVAGLAAAASAFAAFSNASSKAVPGIEATTSALLASIDAGGKAAASTKDVDALFAGIDHQADFLGIWNYSGAIDDLGGAFKRLTNRTGMEGFSDSIDGVFGVINGATKSAEVFNNIGIALGKMVTDGHAGEAKSQFDAMAKKLHLTGDEVNKLQALMPAYGEAMAAGANGTKAAAGAVSQFSADVGVAKVNVEGFGTALDGLFGKTFGVEQATDAWHSSLNGLSAAVKTNGRSIKGTTDKAIANREALRTVAQKAYDVAKAYADTGASAQRVTEKSAALKSEFIKQAMQAGFSRQAAEKYARALDKIPQTVKTNISVAVNGMTQLQSLQNYVNNLHDKHITITASQQGGFNKRMGMLEADGGVVDYFANGSEKHVAQIASAGSTRVWAEPETGGEAYIPLAAGKRTRSKEILQNVAGRFGGQVTFMANGGIQSLDTGGFVSADFSAISGRLPSSAPSRADIAALRLREAKATTTLHAAENALYKLRHTKGHTARQIAASEERLTNARGSLRLATSKLNGAETARTSATKPFATKFHVAAAKSNSSTLAFLKNIDFLRSRGFVTLADQLVMQADDQAYTLASQAARSPAVRSTLTKDLKTSLSREKSLASRQAAVDARYAPKVPAPPVMPTWALPAGVAASTYGARPAPGKIQQIIVKIGDTELTSLVSATVDGHSQQLVDGLVYGGH
jgi:TP901 family phage tail tape measure protein